MKNKKLDIFEKGAYILLKSIKADKLQDVKGKLQIHDEVHFDYVDKKDVWFDFSRRIKFNPEGNFEIYVVMSVCRTLKKNCCDSFDAALFMKDLTRDEIMELGVGVYSKISFIISCLTMMDDGMYPLVTGPIAYKKDK